MSTGFHFSAEGPIAVLKNWIKIRFPQRLEIS
jgi:hypothetical protein